MTDSVDDFIAHMNRRARQGAYDRPDALKELERKADAGDPTAQSMVMMHRTLELRRTLEDSAAALERHKNQARVVPLRKD